MIEKESTVAPDFVVTTVPAVRLAARTIIIDPAAVAEHVEPIFKAVAAGLRHIPGSLATPIATYSETTPG